MFASKSRVERGVVRSFWDDGLIDTLSGVAVLLIGICWQYDLVPIGAIAPAMLVPLWKPLRKRFTEPRLGYVEFSDAQESRQRSFLTWSIAAGFMTFAMGVGVYFIVRSGGGRLPLGNWVAALPACLIGGLAAVTSLLILVPRFIGYAIALVLSGISVVLLDQRPGVALIAGGLVVTSVGLVRLVSFLRSHPQRPLETNGA